MSSPRRFPASGDLAERDWGGGGVEVGGDLGGSGRRDGGDPHILGLGR